MGVQSLDHGDLRIMNRESDSARILDIYRLARNAGLNTNVDIIYGLPGQNMEAMIKNLMAVISLSPKSSTINLYPLVVRELTGMAKILPGGQVSGIEKYEFFHEACRIL
jgi:oxygen-independent coproporphyrinogen-3 oxidase